MQPSQRASKAGQPARDNGQSRSWTGGPRVAWEITLRHLRVLTKSCKQERGDVECLVRQYGERLNTGINEAVRKF